MYRLEFETEEDLYAVRDVIFYIVGTRGYISKEEVLMVIGRHHEATHQDYKVGWDQAGKIVPPDETFTRWTLVFPEPSTIVSTITYYLVKPKRK